MRTTTIVITLLMATASLQVGAAWQDVVPAPTKAPTTDESAPTAENELRDAVLAAFRIELLELALDAASAIPIEPHEKDRSREQEAVAGIGLRLDQPVRVVAYIDQIANWRRGAAYADLAMYCAERGFVTDARRHLAVAEFVAGGIDDWQRDRIRMGIAKVLFVLGEGESAASIESELPEYEAGKISSVRVMTSEADVFESQLKELEHAASIGHFDMLRHALEACSLLFDRHYKDAVRRDAVEHAIKSSWTKVPIQIRVDLLLAMAGFAAEHDDQTKCLALVNEAQQIVDMNIWVPEHLVPMQARLAAMRAKGGDTVTAKTNADAALRLYIDQRQVIQSMDRADALRPLAEAYQSMGHDTAALRVYRLAIEDGAENPNARVRAMDLSATCRSMAASGVEPDDDLWTQLRDIRKGLVAPW